MVQRNDYGQPVGDNMPVGWQAPAAPARTALNGRVARCEPLEPTRHASDLWKAVSLHSHVADWTYLPYGPFENQPELEGFLANCAAAPGGVPFVFMDTASGQPFGWAVTLPSARKPVFWRSGALSYCQTPAGRWQAAKRFT